MVYPSEVFFEAQKLHQVQRFAEAEALYRKVLDSDLQHASAWHHLGLACLAQDKLREAEDGFAHAVALTPENADSLTNLGIALARQQKLSDAVRVFQQAITGQPDYAKAHNNLGVALAQLGQREEDLRCYREAARLQPDYAEAHFNLGVALAERRETACITENRTNRASSETRLVPMLFASFSALISTGGWKDLNLRLPDGVRACFHYTTTPNVTHPGPEFEYTLRDEWKAIQGPGCAWHAFEGPTRKKETGDSRFENLVLTSPQLRLLAE